MKLQLNRFKLLGSDKLVRNLEPHSGTPMPMPTPNPTAMEPWSHETPESSAKKNLLGQLRAPVGVGVALAALKCRPAVCHNFPLFFSSFCCIPIPHCCCTWQFAICNSDLWICTGREGGTSNGHGIICCGISTSMRWQAANWPNDLDGFYTAAAVLLEGKQV